MGILGTVAAPHGHGQANKRTTNFEASLNQSSGNQMRQKWITCDCDVSARNKNAMKQSCEVLEKDLKKNSVLLVKHCKARQRGTLVTIERGRNAPKSTSASTELALLFDGILTMPIGRVGDHGMDGV